MMGISYMRTVAPPLVVLVVMAAAVAFAPRPTHSSSANPVTTKAALMKHLPDVAAVTCDPGGLYLFSDDAPLMAVWIASEPAELYTTDGHFAGALSAEELDRLRDATRPFSHQCLGPEYGTDDPAHFTL